MTSITQVSSQLRTLFEYEAQKLGRAAGLRERGIRLPQLAYLLVLGWLQQPSAGPSALARFAGSLGVTMTKQEVDGHFTQKTADWLLALLRRAVLLVVTAKAVPLPLLQRFSAVLVEDGSTIQLPASLREVWQGCGGNKTTSYSKAASSLKLTVRWDLLKGTLFGPFLQDGKQHDLNSALREQDMPKGSLWIADQGYWNYKELARLVNRGVHFLMRLKPGLLVWEGKRRVDLLQQLPQVVGQRLDMLIDIGASHQLHGVRLLAERVPDEVKIKRQERIQEYARTHQKPVNPLTMELAAWTMIVTSAPASLISLDEAFVFLRARWQIELLFKLWKSGGLLDEWQSVKPWRILCEVYAKLLALVVQHWLLLLSCWDDPHHSFTAVSEIVRHHVPILVLGLRRVLPLDTAIQLLTLAVKGATSIPARSTRMSTSHCLLGGSGPP